MYTTRYRTISSSSVSIIIISYFSSFKSKSKDCKQVFVFFCQELMGQCILFTLQFPHQSHTLMNMAQSCRLSCRGTCSPAGNSQLFHFFPSLFLFFFYQLLSCTPWVVGTQTEVFRIKDCLTFREVPGQYFWGPGGWGGHLSP